MMATMNATIPFRLLRAATFSVVCTGLGVIAHLFGGGTVTASALAVGMVAVFAAATVLAGRERAPAVIVTALVTTQVTVHLVLTFVPQYAHVASGQHFHSGLVPGMGMLVVHAWAAGLTGLWLSRGETALWALIRRAGARFVRVLTLMPSVLPPRRRPMVPAALVATVRPVFPHTLTQRGPPNCSFA